MASPAAVADALEAFIRNQFRVSSEDPDFSRDVHLFEYGYVDSVGATEVLAFVESNFQVQVPDEQLFSEEATTIHGFAAIVAALTT
jgi:methoxymalonate biosynthesis acyl carrier protein